MHVHKPPQRVKTARGESKFSIQTGPLTCHAVLQVLYRHVKQTCVTPTHLGSRKARARRAFQLSRTPFARVRPRRLCSLSCLRAFRVVFGFGSVAVGAPSPNSHPTLTLRGPIPPGLPVVFHPILGFKTPLGILLNISHSVGCGGCLVPISLNPCHFHYKA